MDVDAREQVFHNAVREYIITFLLFIVLYVASYGTVCIFRRKTDSEDIYAGDEDAVVYRISLWICTFTLAVSAGAVLLLPISIVSNEVLLLYPNSYYMQWLNSSLIHGLWNQIFLCSNLALFILMPFAYFFTESEGFSGSRKGIMGRVYETAVVLLLLAILLFGLSWVAAALLQGDKASKQTLFDVWNFYLPYLYSWISFLGVFVLLLCTPLGFARMFTVIGQLVVKPQFLHDIEEELTTVIFKEETLMRKLQHTHEAQCSISNGHATAGDIYTQLKEIRTQKYQLEKRKRVSPWRRNLGYPLVMLLLLVLTVICVLMVVQNTFQLLIGIKALPRGAKETVLGIASLSALGPVGAALEVVLILYLMMSSLVGVYSLPFSRQLQPVLNDTPIVKIIGNCIIILVLSSALPALSRTLGITNFDLLGDFGTMEWLGKLYIILFYNIVFGSLAALCLMNKFTASIRREIYYRFKAAFRRDKKWTQSNGTTSYTKDE